MPIDFTKQAEQATESAEQSLHDAAEAAELGLTDISELLRQAATDCEALASIYKRIASVESEEARKALLIRAGGLLDRAASLRSKAGAKLTVLAEACDQQ